jgi:hypothetical protein
MSNETSAQAKSLIRYAIVDVLFQMINTKPLGRWSTH